MDRLFPKLEEHDSRIDANRHEVRDPPAKAQSAQRKRRVSGQLVVSLRDLLGRD